MAIVDLSGGTFDVSIVDQFSGTLEVRASSGESFLGGEDFHAARWSARILETQGYRFPSRPKFEAPKMDLASDSAMQKWRSASSRGRKLPRCACPTKGENIRMILRR